ncbi:MAG: hypothetical protein MJZ03_00540 [archaeon]|nr:hypothetical protein [archaeon]
MDEKISFRLRLKKYRKEVVNMPAAVAEEDVVFMYNVGDTVYVKENLDNIDRDLALSGEWDPGVSDWMCRKEGEAVKITKREIRFRKGKYCPAYFVDDRALVWSEEFFEPYNIEVSSEEELLQMLVEEVS